MERFEETTPQSGFVPTERTAGATTLRELAEAATPGPWGAWIRSQTIQIDTRGGDGRLPAIVNWPGFDGNDMTRAANKANAAYIAAANPQAILELLDGVEDVADGLRALSCEIHGHKTLGGLSSAMMSMALKLEALSQPPREP